MNYHGTAVKWQGHGILLVGPPGCGKSSLALQLIEQGAILIADDQVIITADRTATCPLVTQGQLHLRDKGMIDVPSQPSAVITIILQSTQPGGALSRAPEIGSPVIAADFKAGNIVTFIKNTLSSASLGFDSPCPAP